MQAPQRMKNGCFEMRYGHDVAVIERGEHVFYDGVVGWRTWFGERMSDSADRFGRLLFYFTSV